MSDYEDLRDAADRAWRLCKPVEVHVSRLRELLDENERLRINHDELRAKVERGQRRTGREQR